MLLKVFWFSIFNFKNDSMSKKTSKRLDEISQYKDKNLFQHKIQVKVKNFF